MGKAKEIISSAIGLAGIVIIARYYPQLRQFINEVSQNGSNK